mgnify:FL=1
MKQKHFVRVAIAMALIAGYSMPAKSQVSLDA